MDDLWMDGWMDGWIDSRLGPEFSQDERASLSGRQEEAGRRLAGGLTTAGWATVLLLSPEIRSTWFAHVDLRMLPTGQGKVTAERVG